MRKILRRNSLANLLYFGLALGLSISAHAQRPPSGPLILNTAWYQPGAFPYATGTLPKHDWLGFAYNPPNTWKSVTCKLVPTSITIRHEEIGERQIELVTYVVANSGTLKRGYWVYLHGVGLRPGPVECAQAQTHFAEVGVALNDPSLGDESRMLATYRTRNYSVAILANRQNGKTRLMMQYQGRKQVLIESASHAPLELLLVNAIADLDRDGKPDIIVSEGGRVPGDPASHLKLYLSSKAAAGQLVGEAASY